LWLDIATHAGLDVRAVADLDALFEPSFRRVVDSRPNVPDALASRLYASPPTSIEALKPLTQSASQAGCTNDRLKGKWLGSLTSDRHPAEVARRDELLEIWRQAGVWLHPDGRIEDVLAVEGHADPPTLRQRAESHPGLDDAARWAAFQLSTAEDEFDLLGVEVERIATALLTELRTQPHQEFYAPVGPGAETDSRLVRVEPVAGKHRLTVVKPEKWAGFWLEVDRATPLEQFVLSPPDGSLPPSGAFE
jgi:hypothetical protein